MAGCYVPIQLARWFGKTRFPPSQYLSGKAFVLVMSFLIMIALRAAVSLSFASLRCRTLPSDGSNVLSVRSIHGFSQKVNSSFCYDIEVTLLIRMHTIDLFQSRVWTWRNHALCIRDAVVTVKVLLFNENTQTLYLSALCQHFMLDIHA